MAKDSINETMLTVAKPDRDGHYYTRKKGEYIKNANFEYVWHRSHHMYYWLKANGCNRVIDFVAGHQAYFGSEAGWKAYVKLINLVRYHVKLHKTPCDYRHPALVALEGKRIIMWHKGKIREGVLELTKTERTGNLWHVLYTVDDETGERGKYPWFIAPWDSIDGAQIVSIGYQ